METGIEWHLLISYRFPTESETHAENPVLFSPLCLTQKSLPAAQDFNGKLIPTPDLEAGMGESLFLFMTPLRFCQVSGGIYLHLLVDWGLSPHLAA